MPFRDDLDLSGFIDNYEEHLYGGSVVHVDGNPESMLDPIKIGRGPAEFSTCTDLSIQPEVCWDVLGYYRTLNVHWRATKQELREAFLALGPEQTPWQMNVLRQLLNPVVRRLYDLTPLGGEFLDDPFIQHQIKMAAKKEALRRSVGSEKEWTMAEVLDERGFNFNPEQDSEKSLETSSDSKPKMSQDARTLRAWSWAYYLWRTGHDNTHAVAEWQALLIAALRERGARPRIAVGFMGKNPRPYAIGVFDNTTVVFLSTAEAPSADLASRAAAALINDPQAEHPLQIEAGS
jgi:hypothetical protein